MSDKLLPCPWCGGPASIGTVREENYGYHPRYIGPRCNECGATPPPPNAFPVSEYDWDARKHVDTHSKAMKSSIEAWNRRPSAALKGEGDE